MYVYPSFLWWKEETNDGRERLAFWDGTRLVKKYLIKEKKKKEKKRKEKQKKFPTGRKKNKIELCSLKVK